MLEPKVMGRPPVPLDMEMIQLMLSEGVPVKEIGDFFNCTVQSIYNHCGQMIAQAKVLRKMEIRQLQNIAARNGNVPMLIHLGKTELKQSEVLPVEADVEDKDENEWKIEPPKFDHKTTLTDSEREEIEGDEE